MTRRGVYPGSFDPPTLAHVAIVEAVMAQRRLDAIDLVISRQALSKPADGPTTPEVRARVLVDSVAHLDGASVLITELQLLADIAAGYDVVVMGADKWHQIHDVKFYDGSIRRRDLALAGLPEIAVAPRPPHSVPPEHALELDPAHGGTSSSRARGGQPHLMTPAAREHARSQKVWGTDA